MSLCYITIILIASLNRARSSKLRPFLIISVRNSGMDEDSFNETGK